MLKTTIAAASLLMASLLAMTSGAFAADFTPVSLKRDGKAAAAPYIQLKPADDVYKIVVLGDSLADGLHQGLIRLNKDNDRLKTTRKSKVNTGLVRIDRYDWIKGAKKIARSGKYQIAVVLLGLNDLQTIRENGKAHHYRTDGWVERYQKRTEHMMLDLKKSGLAVYWTGIPITTPSHHQTDYDYLNSFYKEAAEKTGIRYIDTWKALAGPKGEYSPFWRDADGKLQEIRRKDGVHFTPDGYLIFAGFVNDIIQQDLKNAYSN